MIVMISRELGAGGLTIGEALATDIDGALLDEQTIIAELAKRGGFSSEYLQRTVERPPNPASTFMADLARATALVQAMEWRSAEYAVLDEIRNLVLERAAKENVVVIGHGGSKLLADRVPRDHIFSLLLHARRDWRVGQVMRRFGTSHDDASERVRRTDDLRRKYMQHFFAVDLYDANAYDLVIDTERVGIRTATELCMAALRATRNRAAAEPAG